MMELRGARVVVDAKESTAKPMSTSASSLKNVPEFLLRIQFAHKILQDGFLTDGKAFPLNHHLRQLPTRFGLVKILCDFADGLPGETLAFIVDYVELLLQCFGV